MSTVVSSDAKKSLSHNVGKSSYSIPCIIFIDIEPGSQVRLRERFIFRIQPVMIIAGTRIIQVERVTVVDRLDRDAQVVFGERLLQPIDEIVDVVERTLRFVNLWIERLCDEPFVHDLIAMENQMGEQLSAVPWVTGTESSIVCPRVKTSPPPSARITINRIQPNRFRGHLNIPFMICEFLVRNERYTDPVRSHIKVMNVFLSYTKLTFLNSRTYCIAQSDQSLI